MKKRGSNCTGIREQDPGHTLQTSMIRILPTHCRGPGMAQGVLARRTGLGSEASKTEASFCIPTLITWHPQNCCLGDLFALRMPLREAGTGQVDYRTDSLSGTCYPRGHSDCPEKNATRWVIFPKMGLDPQTTQDGTSQERKTGIHWTMDMCCSTGGVGLSLI